MQYTDAIFSGHAVRQMFHRRIDQDEVLEVLRNGETIAEYPNDQPFPSRLLVGFSAGRPIHVVAGFDGSSGICYVITAYHPDRDLWDDGFKRREGP